MLHTQKLLSVYFTCTQQKHNMPTMGDIRHGLYSRPWLSATHSSTMLMFATLWALIFLFRERGWVVSSFLSMHFKANIFLTWATSTAAPTATRHCLMPNLAQFTCLPPYGRCRACTICFDLHCGAALVGGLHKSFFSQSRVTIITQLGTSTSSSLFLHLFKLPIPAKAQWTLPNPLRTIPPSLAWELVSSHH